MGDTCTFNLKKLGCFIKIFLKNDPTFSRETNFEETIRGSLAPDFWLGSKKLKKNEKEKKIQFFLEIDLTVNFSSERCKLLLLVFFQGKFIFIFDKIFSPEF